MFKVEKRDGRIVEFDASRIKRAMQKAFEGTGKTYSSSELDEIVDRVVGKLGEEKEPVVPVERIQDVVEEVLGKEHFEVSRKYILYRQERTIQREKRRKVHKVIKNIIKKTNRENANVGNSPSSKLLQIAEAEGKDFMIKELTDPIFLEAMNEGIIHPHDYSWGPIGTTTCCFIPLQKLLKGGFDSGHGFIRPPKRIRTAAQLSCIILQSNQNDQHGGQAYGWYDRDMAPFVKKEYEWQINKIMETLCNTGMIDQRSSSVLNYLPKNVKAKIEATAWEYTIEETFQSMEAVVFNLNTMHSRAGAQIPFTSINIGTDTTREGRLITQCLLKAYKNGLGKGEQPIFPNIIFKVKEGVNAYPRDPNFDLLMLSMDTSSSRLFPNYVFQDCSLNKGFPEDVPTMGCRTRVAWNVNSEIQTCEGRGNLSFTTNNLPGIALKVRNEKFDFDDVERKFGSLEERYRIEIPYCYNENEKVKKFFVLLDEYLNITIEQLFKRYEYQCSFIKADFPFLLDGVWMDSDKLEINETLEDVWKHGTLSIGFIGLAEALKCLVGKHHGESRDANKLGEEIVKFMHNKAKEATKKYSLNFSILSTPAEGLSGKFTERDRDKYGVVEGVTDKKWYTNSFHVPVEYDISIYRKIEVEGIYHKYCEAGSISYIELDAAPTHNKEAFYSILRHMMANDMSYVALNFPVDRCRDCNYQGVIQDACPVCESKDISRVRRITGYLAELDMFNSAKKAEAMHRVTHNN